jgi:hypothetical protein
MEDIKKIMLGFKAIEEGTKNFYKPKKEVEDLARKRLEKCSDCLEDAPKLLRVIDKRIPELSGKQCKNCGCIAPFKFRQSIQKCDKWQN